MGRIRVGDLEIVSLVDVNGRYQRTMAFPDAPSSAWPIYDGLYPATAAGEDVALDISSYAIVGRGIGILVDTGLGAAASGPGMMIDNLLAARLRPDEIGTVIFTHLHGDHVGWNFQDGVPTFPNARYVVQEADWRHFTAFDDASASKQIKPLAATGRLELVSGETQLTPELTLLPTPGHTPGHQSVLVSSAGERAFIAGDLSHHPAQVQETEWTDVWDNDRQAAAATRRRVFDQLEREGTIAAFCHFSAPGFGVLVREGGRRIFRAL